MNRLKRALKHLKYKIGIRLSDRSFHKAGHQKTKAEQQKKPARTEVINYLLSLFNRNTYYLEIGVRNPADNHDRIKADVKYSVDPGLSYKENPVDFKMTSDRFFEQLKQSEILSGSIKFDVIFIDGLHLAEQVDKDIKNALDYIKDDGFIVLHDCNPPTEWHAREEYAYSGSPAKDSWNGTTWKAFVKARSNPSINSCCIDSDWGIGIVSKTQPVGKSMTPENTFYEFHVFDKNRVQHLNLMRFEDLKQKLANAGRHVKTTP